MDRPPIESILVSDPPHPGAEPVAWAVGYDDVTKIDLGAIPGLHTDMLTVRVWKDEALFAEYPFAGIKGVIYAAEASYRQDRVSDGKPDCDVCKNGTETPNGDISLMTCPGCGRDTIIPF
jgi:hypothetical protein